MHIKSKRTTTYMPHFLLCFSYGKEGRKFSFECSKEGIVDTSRLNPCALEFYNACMSDAASSEVLDYSKYVITPAVGECSSCGLDVHLSSFTNTCECGSDYNMSGQLLAYRSQWGEETGESLSDILSIP